MANKQNIGEITPKFILSQLGRMGGLHFFPKEKKEIMELVKQFQTSNSEQVVENVINDWMAEHPNAPAPSEIRTMVIQENLKLIERRVKCHICEGRGVTTSYRLVTYKGNTHSIERSVKMDCDMEGCKEFNETLAKREKEGIPGLKRQAVIVVAEKCVCVGIR